MASAIAREKQMKAWKRDWKVKSISAFNPEWKDLFELL
jgi:putative endonuclease